VERPISSKPPSFLWISIVALALALGLAAWGVAILQSNGQPVIFAAGALGTILSLVALGISLDAAMQRRTHSATFTELINPVNERLQHVSVLLNQVSEQQRISERTKAIAFRDKDREALRLAIRDEINKRDWEGALKLVDEIEAVFGYKQEADRFREEIFQQRDAEIRKVVDERLAIIDKHCRAEHWSQAFREADSLMGMFPKDAQVSRLTQDIETRRQDFKKQLRDSWQDAVGRHDVDGSIEILKKLDLYLTPQEATELQDTVRQVFRDKLQLLGQQFTLAVKDHKWSEAVRLGESIIREFPNSRMATEVREKMDLLRQRAAEGATPAMAV